MRADLLYVVTAYSNPLRWRSRLALYQAFEAHMLASGVNLTVVECAYGNRPFEIAAAPGVQHVGVRASTMVWVKENLLNLGIARLPSSAKYIATLDADITFRSPSWAADAVHALQLHPVIQPWSECYDLGPAGEHLELHRSFASLYLQVQMPSGKAPYGGAFPHPGYAWCWTRQALEWTGGLIDTAILGAGDHHMATALIGHVDRSIHGGVTAGYKAPLFRWQDAAMHHMAGNLGYLQGTIEHIWHGPKQARAYQERWQILVDNAFDPAADLKRNTYGVWEWTGNKPKLQRDVAAYFKARNEDSNDATS